MTVSVALCTSGRSVSAIGLGRISDRQTFAGSRGSAFCPAVWLATRIAKRSSSAGTRFSRLTAPHAGADMLPAAASPSTKQQHCEELL